MPEETERFFALGKFYNAVYMARPFYNSVKELKWMYF